MDKVSHRVTNVKRLIPREASIGILRARYLRKNHHFLFWGNLVASGGISIAAGLITQHHEPVVLGSILVITTIKKASKSYEEMLKANDDYKNELYINSQEETRRRL